MAETGPAMTDGFVGHAAPSPGALRAPPSPARGEGRMGAAMHSVIPGRREAADPESSCKLGGCLWIPGSRATRVPRNDRPIPCPPPRSLLAPCPRPARRPAFQCRHSSKVSHRPMKIAAINSPQGKVFGAVEGDSFRPFSVGGGVLRDLRHVIKLFAAGSGAGLRRATRARARQARRPGRPALQERDLRRQELLRPRARIRPERRRPVGRQAGGAGRSGDLHQVAVRARRSGAEDRRRARSDRTRSTTRASSA